MRANDNSLADHATQMRNANYGKRLRPKSWRIALAWAGLTAGLGCLAAGAAYWSASDIRPLDRETSRARLTLATPPKLIEQSLAGDYLTACVAVMAHWTFSIEPRAEQREVEDACLKIANTQETLDIASAEAALVVAQRNWREGDGPATISALLLAQERAPRDLWNAMQRVELMLQAVPLDQLRNYDAYFSQEFALLTNTYNGVRTAVTLYAKYPQLRPALVAISEEMSGPDRLRFLNLIKRQAGS